MRVFLLPLSLSMQDGQKIPLTYIQCKIRGGSHYWLLQLLHIGVRNIAQHVQGELKTTRYQNWDESSSAMETNIINLAHAGARF